MKEHEKISRLTFYCDTLSLLVFAKVAKYKLLTQHKVGRPKLIKYYLKHEHECFIRYKMRGAAERFISDKARIASVLNNFKNDPFYTHLVTLFTKEFSI